MVISQTTSRYSKGLMSIPKYRAHPSKKKNS